ncbi:MAG: tetratricopeptide repeat protein [Rickettsiales bacterium]|nr:tetratricopeptide repeat protein [Rickettsiales bacterium]
MASTGLAPAAWATSNDGLSSWEKSAAYREFTKPSAYKQYSDTTHLDRQLLVRPITNDAVALAPAAPVAAVKPVSKVAKKAPAASREDETSAAIDFLPNLNNHFEATNPQAGTVLSLLLDDTSAASYPSAYRYSPISTVDMVHNPTQRARYTTFSAVLAPTIQVPLPPKAIAAAKLASQATVVASNAALPAITSPATKRYKSPGIIVQRQKIVYASSQNLAKDDDVFTLTEEELAQLVPAAGEPMADNNTPLIQLPDITPPQPAGSNPPITTVVPIVPGPTGDAMISGTVPALTPLVEPTAVPTASSATPPEPAGGVVVQKPISNGTQVFDNLLDPTENTALNEVPRSLPPIEVKDNMPPVVTVTKETTTTITTETKTAPKTAIIAPTKPDVDKALLDIAKPDTLSEPSAHLSKQSRELIKAIPSNIDAEHSRVTEPLDVDRSKDTDYLRMKEPTRNSEKVSSQFGVKMEVKNASPINWDYELEKAYNALISGNTDAAITIYRNILENDPDNKPALFGLATTLHRAGQLSKARELYAKLLSLAPDHRDALNNFLVLLADEAPEEALTQLSKLEKRNPDFSPIPAQMAVIYQKIGKPDKATEKMFRAIALAPENLTYRYNLAILLDKQKNYDEAAKLYRQILEAHMRGEVIPGDAQKVQQRLTFISSNRP